MTLPQAFSPSSAPLPATLSAAADFAQYVVLLTDLRQKTGKLTSHYVHAALHATKGAAACAHTAV